MTLLESLNVSYQGDTANTLFYEPMFMDQDLLSQFRVIPNVTSKRKLAFVQELEKVVRNYTGCGFAPAGSTKMYDRWVEVDRCKVDMVLCWEEFKDTVHEELLKKGVSIGDVTGTLIFDILQRLIVNAVKKDNLRLAFFGNRASTSSAYDITDGLFTVHLPAFIAANQTPYVNAGSGSALAAGAGIALMRAVFAAQAPALYGLPANMKKFYVDRSVFESYRLDVENGGGGDGGITLLQNGQTVFTFRGIEIVPMVLWSEIMATDFASATSHQVLLTSPDNLVLATDLQNQDSQFTVWYDEKDENVCIKARWKMGFQVIHPALMVAAY